MRKKSAQATTEQAAGAPHYRLRLFVAGNEPNSVRAKGTLFRIRETYLQERCEIELIDVYQDYQAAIDQHIVIVPCLVIVEPPPARSIVGSLSDETSLLAALGISK